MEYALEQLNYFRICRIIVKLVPAGLRKIFKQEWDFRYSTTSCGMWQDTPQNGDDFHLKETMTKRRKPAMDRRYLNIIRNGNTAGWDCSCLFSAILFSNSIGTTLSAIVKKNVKDLRQVRNDLALIANYTLTDDQFQSYAERVSNAFISLGLLTDEIDEVKNQTGFPTAEVEDLKNEIGDLKTELDQTKSELETTTNELQSNPEEDLSAAKEENDVLTREINSKVEPFCFLTFTPPHEIIRRSSDLARIKTHMQELYDRSNGAVSTVYLSGNPGCGKSQLARQIGEEFYNVRSRDTEDLIFVATLNAETLESLADSYLTLAANLNIPLCVIKKMEKSKRKKPEETLKQAMWMVYQKIARFSNWLIIADNVVNLQLVQCYFPQTASKEWGHGQVLITTQDSITIPSNAPHTYHESLQEGMQREDAVELLKQVSHTSNQEQAEEVAEVLEYQPLALAAAAFYVQTVVSSWYPDYSWRKYLGKLREDNREATKEPLANPNMAYLKRMTEVVGMAIKIAMETSDVISQAFFFLSLCAAEPITVEAVVSFVKNRLGNYKDEELIRATILKSSLIVFKLEDGSPKNLRLHNIVHNVLKTLSFLDYDSTQKFGCIATAINIFESQLREHLSTAVCGDVKKLGRITSHSKSLCGVALSNSDATAGLLENLPPSITPDKVVSWLTFTAEACLIFSDLSQATRLCNLPCDSLQCISNSRDGNILRSRVCAIRGSVLCALCDFNSAFLYEKDALTIRIKLYGEEHADVAKSYHKLGDVFKGIGQHDRAKKFHQKALNIRIKVYGEDHGDVAESYEDLGIVCKDIGQHDKAKDLLEKALNIKIKLYGEDHGEVAKSYEDLGIVSKDIGQHNEAKEFLERALNIRLKLYGEEHGKVATSYHTLATMCLHIRQPDQSIEYYQKAIGIRIKLFGEDRGDVAIDYDKLGYVCSEIGQHHQEKEFYEKALKIRIKLYGEEHGEVATSYDNLGDVCSDIVQYDHAKEFYEKALNIRNNLHGEEHGDVAESYHKLGNVLNDSTTKLRNFTKRLSVSE